MKWYENISNGHMSDSKSEVVVETCDNSCESCDEYVEKQVVDYEFDTHADDGGPYYKTVKVCSKSEGKE